MIVDPNTGVPVGEPIANTIGGNMGMAGLSGMGITSQDLPLAYDMLENLPSAFSTMGWNVGRVQNTLIQGSRRGATRARGVRQTFSPLAMRRFGSATNIDPTWAGPKTYTPFNFLASLGNKAYGRITTRFPSVAASMGARLGTVEPGAVPFSGGTLGRIATVGKIGAMSDAQFARRMPSIVGSLGEMTGSRGWVAGRFANASLGFTDDSVRSMTQRAVLDTIGGTWSARAAGWIQGIEGRTLAAGSNAMIDRGWAQGFKTFSHMSPGMQRFMARAPITAATRAMPVIGWALLAKDVGMMAGKMTATAINTAIDAGRSIQGSINKPVFGMGYRDNMINATSRQRGVNAISNSRLNARSVLGSEASYIHASWG